MVYINKDVVDNSDIGLLEINIWCDDKVFISNYVSVIENVTNNYKYLNKNITNKFSKVLKV